MNTNKYDELFNNQMIEPEQFFHQIKFALTDSEWAIYETTIQQSDYLELQTFEEKCEFIISKLKEYHAS